MAASQSYGPRPWTFYVLATLFTLFVIFLYGPMIAILVLSFQGPSASLVFPLREPSRCGSTNCSARAAPAT